MLVKCSTCSREYIYNSKKRQGHTRTRCNSCMCNQYRPRMKQKAVDYKGGCCNVCGYKNSLRALVFHHTDSNKDFGISDPPSWKWEKLKEELDKCVLLCANCHAEAHEAIDAEKLS